MKTSKRIISILLTAALAFGIVGTGIISVAATTDATGYTANTTGTYMDVPADRLWLSTDLTALKSMFGGTAVVAKTDKTYDNTNIKIIDCTASKTGSDWNSFTGGTSFAKGLGVHPQKIDTAGYAIYDLTGLNVNRFYSAVGLTKAAKTDYGVRFRIYTMANGSDTFVEVANSGEVKRGASGEFVVDITGCKQLKLSVETVSTHTSLSSVFANACVYCDHDLTHVDAKAATENNSGILEHYHCTLCDGYFDAEMNKISALEIIDRKTPYHAVSDAVYAEVPAAAVPITASMIPESWNFGAGSATTVNVTAKLLDSTAVDDGTGKWSGGTQFTKGLGVHPKSGTEPGYTIVDLTDTTANRFYAAVGITHSGVTGSDGSGRAKNTGVFKVYGSIDKKDYVLLATSDNISRGSTGEFDVDITGCNYLKLEYAYVTGGYATMNAMWANACVYNVCNHDLSFVEGQPAVNGSIATIDHYHCANCGLDFADEDAQVRLDSIYKTYTANTSGTYMTVPADRFWLSTDIPFTSYVTPASGSSTPRVAVTDGKWATNNGSGNVKIGDPQHNFNKGLAVSPSAKTATQDAYILSDISGVNANRFYAAIGITGSAATGGTNYNNELGVNCYVYGSKVRTTSHALSDFDLLASSGDVIQKQTGEFVVDITGYKTLLLVTDTIPGKENYGCDMFWANACVYTVCDHENLSRVDAVAGSGNTIGTVEYWHCEDCGQNFADEGATQLLATVADNYIHHATSSFSYKSVPANATRITKSMIKKTASYSDSRDAVVMDPTTTTKLIDAKATKGTDKWSNGTSVTKGITGVHPVKENTAGYVTLDLSGCTGDRFYSAVGLTDGSKTTNGGLIFKIYGTTDDVTTAENAATARFTDLLAQSEPVLRGTSGEFTVDIGGYTGLKLVYEYYGGASGASYAGMANAWANACVYCAHESMTLVPSVGATATTPGVKLHYACSLCGKLFADAAGKTAITEADTVIPPVVYKGAPEGALYLGSDIALGDSKNGGDPGKATTVDHCYNENTGNIVIRDGTATVDATGKWTNGTVFTKGLGVHPRSATNAGYTYFDLSDVPANRFYSVVGITHNGIKSGNLPTDCGVNFKVSGTKDGESYTLLEESGTIKRGMSYEFDTDISGCIGLKLEIAYVSGTGTYASLASAWGNACVYMDFRFNNASITVSDTMQANLKIPAKVLDAFVDPVVTVTMEGHGEMTFTKSELIKSGDNYVCSITDIIPYEMANEITATLTGEYNGEEVTGKETNFSIAAYCYGYLNNEACPEDLRTLLVDLLNYGTESQKREGITEGLVNADLTDTQKAWATADRTLVSVKDANYATVGSPSATWRGVGLNLIDGIQIRVKFYATDVTGMSVYFEDEDGHSKTVSTFTNVPGEKNCHYAFLTGLNAYQISTPITATVKNGGNAVSNTLRYSIESYAFDAQGITDGNLDNLVRAMVRYGDSAKVYNDNHS